MGNSKLTQKQRFYTVDNTVSEETLTEYDNELPKLIMKNVLPLSLIMLAFILLFSFTDLLVHKKVELFLTRVPAIILTFTLIFIYFSNLKSNRTLVILINNLYSSSLLFMGLFILIILFPTPIYRSGIIAFIMLTVASYFFVKGLYSILLVYCIPFIFGVLYFVLVIKPQAGIIQELMNPVVSYIVMLFIALLSEKSRYKEFYFKSGLKKEKLLTEELYFETLTQNEELQQLNENLLETRENLELANNTKDRLFSVIAHDLRSAFSILLGFSNWLVSKKNELTKEEMNSVFPKLQKTSEDAFKLLENLLGWSMAQTGDINCEPKISKAAKLIKESVELSENIAHEKNIMIHISAQESALIYVDVDMFATIMRNLITNAIKFSHSNSHITIRAVQQNKHIKIEIDDNGVGIEEEKLTRLFEVQKNQSSLGTQKEKGTGLGLMLCKDFVETMNGKINIDSQKGVGTKVTLVFPSEKDS